MFGKGSSGIHDHRNTSPVVTGMMWKTWRKSWSLIKVSGVIKVVSTHVRE